MSERVVHTYKGWPIEELLERFYVPGLPQGCMSLKAAKNYIDHKIAKGVLEPPYEVESGEARAYKTSIPGVTYKVVGDEETDYFPGSSKTPKRRTSKGWPSKPVKPKRKKKPSLLDDNVGTTDNAAVLSGAARKIKRKVDKAASEKKAKSKSQASKAAKKKKGESNE